MFQPSGIEMYQNLWPIHAILMTTGAVLLILGGLIAHTMKEKPSWLKNHHFFEFVGFLCVITALIISFYMVSASGGPQFRVLHAYSGIITFAFVTATLILGPLNMKVKSHNKEIRKMHRWVGRITFILLIVQIVIGLFTAKIL